MQRFRRKSILQKFIKVHVTFHKHFNLERYLIDRKTYAE